MWGLQEMDLITGYVVQIPNYGLKITCVVDIVVTPESKFHYKSVEKKRSCWTENEYELREKMQ